MVCCKFDMDIKQAKVAMAGPEKKVTTESKIEQEADEALKDPKSADKLRKEAAQAEMDMASGIGIITPTAFIQEGASKDTDTEDIGESGRKPRCCRGHNTIPLQMTISRATMRMKTMAWHSWAAVMLMWRRPSMR